jgi:hypothetical protein
LAAGTSASDPLEVDVLDAKLAALEQAEAAARR